MKKINVNDGLDPNNPAHELLIQINNRNEEIYGKYHSDCGLFEFFCHCKKRKLGNEQSR